MNAKIHCKGRQWRASFCLVALAAAGFSSIVGIGEARADDATAKAILNPDDATGKAVKLDPQAEASRTAEFWKTKVADALESTDKDVLTCFEKLKIEAARTALRRELATWDSNTKKASNTAAEKQRTATAAETAKETRLEAETELTKAKREQSLADNQLRDATARLANAANGTAAVRTALDAERTKAQTAATAAEAKVTKATTELASRQKEESDAQKDADKAAKTYEEAQSEMEPKRKQLLAALEQLTSRSAGGFKEFLSNSDRLTACSKVRSAYLSFKVKPANAENVEAVDNAKDDAIAKSAGDTARAEDLLRKASPLTSALGSGNGFLEAAGAPDRAIFSVMSALGADQDTNGTQMVMTLGLSGLFGWSDEERLKQKAPIRNLFLKATLPLSSTTPDPVAGSPESTDAAATVTRMSLVLGTSLSDDSDPRLALNQSCYKNALVYRWNGLLDPSESARQEERADDFDLCNRLAAEKNKLAVRAGLGLLVDNGKTQVETFGATFVWAPTSWLYFNGIYQRLFLPSERHSFGGGLSFGVNLGGKGDSGVDAWTRIGFDALVLGVYSDAEQTTETEIRLQLTTKFKLSNNVVSLGIGPRLLGDALSDPGVLASVALSYDADELLGPLLQPAPEKP